GNEVWLVTFGGALFAAFPVAYATILSAFYIPVMMLLSLLILRAVSVDFRNKVQTSAWKFLWEVGFFISSAGATYVFGVAAGNWLQGIPIDESGDYLGTTLALFNPYSISVGVLALATFALQGFAFLILKTTKELKQKLSGMIWTFWGFFLVSYILVSMFTLIEQEHVVENIRQNYWPIPIVIANVLAVANLPRCILKGHYGQAFISSSLNIACLVAIFGLSLYPTIVYSTGPGESLSIQDAASSQNTLWLMFIFACVGLPLILSYTAIIYWTFRKAIDVEETMVLKEKQ
ncbi:MAG: cytochrome d ubiquinol oxidase subunit II, partial [Planctomycetota bacterium]